MILNCSKNNISFTLDTFGFEEEVRKWIKTEMDKW